MRRWPLVVEVVVCHQHLHTDTDTDTDHTTTHKDTRHMPGLVVNTQEAMEARKPLPEGEYHVTLTNSTVKPAVSADKYASLILEFTVCEDEGEFAGKKAFRNLSASPKAVGFMVDAAVALGADPDEVVQPSVDMEAVFKELHAQECWIVTSIRKYKRDENSEEVEQTNVDRINAAPSA